MIQKQKEEDPSTSASQQEASQSGKLNTYVLLHSIRILFTARFKNKRKKIHSRQHRSKKRVNRANQTLTACFIPFAQQLPHDSKTKKKINPHQHRSKKRVNQENEILTACSIPFPQYLTHDSKTKKKV